ncbi:MAG: methylenetetrahydrofolate reductase [NAD(P)H] [Chloroflexota bacterium]
MIKKISDILKEKERTYSFEFYPPKTEEGRKKLPETVSAYLELKPDWFAVTYGAGGTTREWTTAIVDDLQKRFDVPVIHHLTCVGHNKQELQEMLETLTKNNIRNILALRGDPPVGVKDWVPSPGGFEYCYQLINLIRSYDNYFSIGVAGFPEGHIKAPDKATDARYLKVKLDAGGEFIISQLFYDNKDYFDYIKRIRAIGVKARVIPGIMPIPSYQGLLKFTSNCGASIPQFVTDIFKPLDGNDEASYRAGVDFCVKQCQELLDGGAPGLHFFTMNKVNPVMEIIKRLKR